MPTQSRSSETSLLNSLPVVRIAMVAVAFSCVAAALLSAPAANAFHPGKPTEIWVSPNGNNGADGSKARPLRSLAAARNHARRVMRRGQKADVRILLMDGIFRLKRSLYLDWRDSGRGEHRVIYAAAPKAKPVVSGSIAVRNFKLYDRAARIYRAKVPVGSQSRQLYVNGRRALRARSTTNPNGFTRTAAGYEAPDDAMASWRRPSDIELATVTQWKMMRCPVAAIAGRQIAMQQPCWNNVNVFPKLWSFQLISWIENAYELLDQPGEWYMDGQAGWLYYIPRAGERISNTTAELPLREALVRGRGTNTRPISNIRFEGITFEHATWLLPSGSDGYAADQSGFHLTGDGHVPNSIGHDMDTARTPGSVRFRFAHNVEFVRNSFRRLGAVGLDFDTGAQHNRIVGNHFNDVSSAAIQLGGVDVEDHHPTTAKEVTRDNEIANNLIKHTGREYQDVAGIFVGFAARTTITHNDISEVPWSGIAIGWGWGLVDPGSFPGLPGAKLGEWGIYATDTPSLGNRIAYNRITNYLSKLWDGGGVYTVGQQGSSLAEGEVIEGNVISNKRRLAGGNTIYTDGGSRYVTIRNNVLFENDPGITDFGPCDVTDAIELCWVVLPYGSDRGGCRPYGDIVYSNNYWQHPAAFFEACPYPPYPVNVTDQNNTVITGPEAISEKLLKRAGLQRAFRNRVGAG